MEVTPYTAAEVPDLMFTQSADVMYVVHPDHYPLKISRLAHDSWSLDYVSIEDGPYKPWRSSDADIMITSSARTGNNVNLVASSALFASKHVGLPLRLGFMNPLDATDIQWGYGVIDQVTDSTNARMDVVAPLGFDHVFNPRFEMALVGWADKSTGGTVTFDSATGTMVLTMGGTGISDSRQELEVIEGERLELNVTIDSIQGTVRVLIGTTSGGTEITTQTYTTTGTKLYTFVPTQSEIHITIDNTGSSSGNVSKISEVSVTRYERATPDWRIGAWNDTDGYPRTVGIVDQRLIFGGTLAYPLTRWESKTGSFEDFGFNSPLEDSDSLTYDLDTGEVVDQQWIASLSAQVVGTSGSEWRIKPKEGSGSLTPTSIDAKPQSWNGCAKIPPIKIGSTVLYLQRGAFAVRDLAYSLEADGYAGFDRSIMANHLFDGHTIVDWGYARLPYSIIWMVRDDGVLLGLTYMKEQEVWGFHQHVTDGEYESVGVVPGDEIDWVYTVVKRTINGSTKRYIEVFMPRITDEDTYDYFFVDCGLTYDGAATTTITGLSHLEGKAVAVLADGSVVPGKTVASGQITLPVAASLVHVGLPFTSDLELPGVVLNDRHGSSEGRTRSIPFVNVRFEKSRGAFAGPDADHLDEFRFRDEAYGEDPIPLTTGNRNLTFNSGYDTSGRVFIRNTDPIPITVLTVTPNVELSER